ncbi:uncharacterized protein LOC142748427 [Rhinoderma darwinii]|uniref:uncharacterized protein LOC142748427 n=1 Tax=Rhinoderma darwinii TaxID=43563 RepID=UPI003F6750E6
MIVPCHYSVKTPGEVQQVSWYTGDSRTCSYNLGNIYTSDPTATDNPHRFSLVNFPGDVSLRIHSVESSEYQRFCCRVTTSNRTIQSRFGTELIIAGSPSTSPFTVTQPYTITGHRGESVTLKCSYSSYMKSDVLGVNIYWRLGNISGPYVYHPYTEMVYPGYSGRTEIKGPADLHIQRLEMSDDSMYYCFVMIKLCTGYDKYENIIQYGEGTRLIVTDPSNGLDEYKLVIIIYISAAVLLVLLCVILVILKTTGVICKKKNFPDERKTSNSPDNVEFALEEKPYCEILTQNTMDKRMEGETDGQENENILYSELNKTKLGQRNLTSNQKAEEQIVYAAVTCPDSRE